MIKSSSLTSDELCTFIVRADAIVNSRPITAVYDDCKEPQPLSPSDFLLGRSPLEILSGKCDLIPQTIDRTQFLNYFDCKKKFMSELWKRWRCEYLRFLRISQKFH